MFPNHLHIVINFFSATNIAMIPQIVLSGYSSEQTELRDASVSAFAF